MEIWKRKMNAVNSLQVFTVIQKQIARLRFFTDSRTQHVLKEWMRQQCLLYCFSLSILNLWLRRLFFTTDFQCANFNFGAQRHGNLMFQYVHIVQFMARKNIQRQSGKSRPRTKRQTSYATIQNEHTEIKCENLHQQSVDALIWIFKLSLTNSEYTCLLSKLFTMRPVH